MLICQTSHVSCCVPWVVFLWQHQSASKMIVTSCNCLVPKLMPSSGLWTMLRRRVRANQSFCPSLMCVQNSPLFHLKTGLTALLPPCASAPIVYAKTGWHTATWNQCAHHFHPSRQFHLPTQTFFADPTVHLFPPYADEIDKLTASLLVPSTTTGHNGSSGSVVYKGPKGSSPSKHCMVLASTSMRVAICSSCHFCSDLPRTYLLAFPQQFRLALHGIFRKSLFDALDLCSHSCRWRPLRSPQHNHDCAPESVARLCLSVAVLLHSRSSWRSHHEDHHKHQQCQQWLSFPGLKLRAVADRRLTSHWLVFGGKHHDLRDWRVGQPQIPWTFSPNIIHHPTNNLTQYRHISTKLSTYFLY